MTNNQIDTGTKGIAKCGRPAVATETFKTMYYINNWSWGQKIYTSNPQIAVTGGRRNIQRTHNFQWENIIATERKEKAYSFYWQQKHKSDRYLPLRKINTYKRNIDATASKTTDSCYWEQKSSMTWSLNNKKKISLCLWAQHKHKNIAITASDGSRNLKQAVICFWGQQPYITDVRVIWPTIATEDIRQANMYQKDIPASADSVPP